MTIAVELLPSPFEYPEMHSILEIVIDNFALHICFRDEPTVAVLVQSLELGVLPALVRHLNERS